MKCRNCSIEFKSNKSFPSKKYCSIKCRVDFNKKKYRKSKKGKDKEKEYSKSYYKQHGERLRKKRIDYYYNNQELEKERRRKYYYNNLDKENSEANKIKRRDYKREYRKNPENKKKMWKWQKKKLKEDKDYYIRSTLRTRLNHAINYYRKHGIIIKCKSGLIDYNKIIEHLKPFPKNIKEYHIDHIKPLSSFNLVSKDGSLNLVEIRKAFSPKNHQWLKAKDNLKKWKN